MAQPRNEDKEMADAIGLGHLSPNRIREAGYKDDQELKKALGLDHLDLATNCTGDRVKLTDRRQK